MMVLYLEQNLLVRRDERFEKFDHIIDCFELYVVHVVSTPGIFIHFSLSNICSEFLRCNVMKQGSYENIYLPCEEVNDGPLLAMFTM